MTPSFLVSPTDAPRSNRKGFKELAVFGLRKAFIDPAPRPKQPSGRMERYFGDSAKAMDFFVPE